MFGSLSGFIFLRVPGNLQQPEDYEEEYYRNKLDNDFNFNKRIFEKDSFKSIHGKLRKSEPQSDYSSRTVYHFIVPTRPHEIDTPFS